MVGPAKRLTPQPMLVVTSDGPLQGQTMLIEADEVVIGRRNASDIVLADPRVSSTHARLRRSKGAVLVEDLGSTNGTFVNEEPLVGSQALRHGDAIRFGTIETRFEDRGSMMGPDDATEIMEVAVFEDVMDKPVLSPRQNEVLAYLKQGLTNPQIAERLGVTERTVKAHCQEVYDRLGVPNRTAAVDAAHRLGLPDEG